MPADGLIEASRRHPAGARLLWVAALAFASLAAGERITPIDPPAPPGSTSPALAAEGATTASQGHDILLTWLEPDAAGVRLRFGRYSSGSWHEPVTVAGGVAALAPADRPSLTVIDTQGVRRTLIARTGDVVARSGDAGRTWARLPAPGLPFASFAGADEGAYAFWLRPGGDGAAELLGTRVLAGESLLDARAANGSGTAATMTWDGPVVVYRGAGARGAQTIKIVRRQSSRWTEPQPVHAETWRTARTPSSGPRIAALRRRVAVVWTAEVPSPRLLAAFSEDAGRTFGTAVEVDSRRGDSAPSGPVDVVLDDGGNALILWLATDGPGSAALNLARVSAEGERGEALVLARGPSTHFEGFAQIARAGERAAVAWVDAGAGRVRAAAVPLAAVAPIPAPDERDPDPAAVAAGESSPPAGRGQVGEIVPDSELMTLEGERVTLEGLRGHAVLLNLWATWCLPCLAEMPELAALHERHGPDGLVLVGLSVDDEASLDRVHAFVAEREIPFTVWLDPAQRLYDALRVRSLPVTLVIGREGRITLRRDRAITADDPELGEALRAVLAVP